jgi:hypothetical protein
VTIERGRDAKSTSDIKEYNRSPKMEKMRSSQREIEYRRKVEKKIQVHEQERMNHDQNKRRKRGSSD